MSKQTTTDAARAERERILKILYRGDVTLPGPVANAINSGQDARKFCPERPYDETPPAAAASARAATGGKWTEIVRLQNAAHRAAAPASAAASVDPTEASQ